MAKTKRKSAKTAPPPPETHPLRLEYRRPSELAANPQNWRRHPDAQLTALADVIGEVGWAGVLLYNERTKRLIDGHARKEIAEETDEPVPVVIGNWTEEQERTILATLDPLAAMAEADSAALAALMHDVQSGSEAVQQMLSKLAEDAGVIPPDFRPAGIEEQGRLDEKAKCKCPECGHEFTP